MAANNFWDDLDAAAAYLVRDTLLGENIEQAAQHLEKSSDLLYKASNPHQPQQLNLKQWLKVLRLTRNYTGVRQLAEACGFIVLRRDGQAVALLRELAAALEREGK